MLQRGFTHRAHAGGADSGHRMAVEKSLFPDPRLFVSGKNLLRTGGHGDHRANADTCGCSAVSGGMSVVANGMDEVRKAVRENVRQGVDQIKMMGGGLVSFRAVLSRPDGGDPEMRSKGSSGKSLELVLPLQFTLQNA